MRAITHNEQLWIESFAGEHANCKRKKKKPAGDINIRVRSAATMGTHISVKCKGCGAVRDVTEYERW